MESVIIKLLLRKRKEWSKYSFGPIYLECLILNLALRLCFNAIFKEQEKEAIDTYFFHKRFSLVQQIVTNLSVWNGVSGFGVTDLLADEADQEDDNEGGNRYATVANDEKFNITKNIISWPVCFNITKTLKSWPAYYYFIR